MFSNSLFSFILSLSCFYYKVIFSCFQSLSLFVSIWMIPIDLFSVSLILSSVWSGVIISLPTSPINDVILNNHQFLVFHLVLFRCSNYFLKFIIPLFITSTYFHGFFNMFIIVLLKFLFDKSYIFIVYIYML